MNKARGAVRTKLSDTRVMPTSVVAERTYCVRENKDWCTLLSGEQSVCLTGQVCSRVMEAQDGCCKGGWAGWRRGSVPSKEPQL